MPGTTGAYQDFAVAKYSYVRHDICETPHTSLSCRFDSFWRRQQGLLSNVMQEYVGSAAVYSEVPLTATLDFRSKARADGLQYRAGVHYVRSLTNVPNLVTSVSFYALYLLILFATSLSSIESDQVFDLVMFGSVMFRNRRPVIKAQQTMLSVAVIISTACEISQ